MLKRGFILLTVLLLISVGIRVNDAFHLFKKAPWASHFSTGPIIAQAKEEKEQKEKKPSQAPLKTKKDKGANPSLDAREEELRLREERIKQEEANLRALKKEIEAKLEQLKALEAKVTKLLKKRDEREEKRLVQLARVFESTPPEQAGPLLSKLDVKTAAEILYRMNGRKAGKIWGYVDADRAVKISEELTKLKDAQ